MLAQPIQKLIEAFTRLPGVGPKTAQRFTIHLLKSGRGEVVRLERALEDLLQNIRSCEICHNFSDTSPCEICSDSRRDQTMICVVAEPQDVIAIEKSGTYKGVYHVLRGVIDPLIDAMPQQMKLAELMERAPGATEIIFALDPTIEGEVTVQYLSKRLAREGLAISRLATGIPSGGSVEYADEITLGSAFKARQKV
jgi:recombination protein RecR